MLLTIWGVEMSDIDEDDKGQFHQLLGEISTLKDIVGGLAERVAILEKCLVPLEISSQQQAGLATGSQKSPESVGWTKMSQEVLLPRVAAICFMMVVALVLRTVSDNGMIDRQLGSLFGTVYAVGLIAWGWRLYGKSDKLAPVFPACGVLLLYSILYEATVHFGSLSAITAFTMLLVSEIIVVIIALRCRAVFLLCFAIFSSTFVGIAMGFPEPIFALLGVVLLVNNIAAQRAVCKGISFSLRWYTLFFSVIFWLLWTYKLNYDLHHGSGAEELGLFWSMPVLALFYLFYLYSSLSKTCESAHKIGFFNYLMPVINAGGSFWVVYFIIGPWLGVSAIIGQGGVFVSGLYIALVLWMIKGDRYDIRGGKEYVSAACILLIEALPLAIPAIWAMPIWVVAAAILTIQSHKWQSGAVRLISYLFQIFIVVFAFNAVNYQKSEVPWLMGFFLAAGMGFVCLWLFHWCRKNYPEYESYFFKSVDPQDLMALLLLMVGLLHLYSMFRFASFALVQLFFEHTPYAFSCSKSIIINLGTVALMIVGLRSKTRELLLAATPLVIIGAIRVFLFDLFRGEGVPLVLSVFSFGVVAVVSSVVMKKWGIYQKTAEQVSTQRTNG